MEPHPPRKMRKNIISFLLVIQCFTLLGRDGITPVKYDSSAVEWRQFDKQKIAEHKADPSFNYGNRPVPGLSIWERFIMWINRVLGRLFYMGTTTPIGKIITYTLIAAVIVYALLKLLKVDVRRTFYSNADASSLPYEVHDENIHEMDFESLIKEAVEAKEFKNAIRLIYLFALKNLADKHLVEWQPGKTNHDYLFELKREEVKEGFGSLSFYFEYAWYGDFPISEELFADVDRLFNRWRKGLPG